MMFPIKILNPCYLSALILLALFSKQIPAFSEQAHGPFRYLVVPAITGTLTAALNGTIYGFIRKLYFSYDPNRLKTVLNVSFLCGVCVWYSALYHPFTFIMFTVIAGATVISIRDFLESLWTYLSPKAILTKRDLFHVVFFYLTLLTAFIVLNLTVEYVHIFLNTGKAFNFAKGLEGVLDAVYFTFVMLTTVGFGDIVPLTPLAKIVVSFECMAGYILFALIIGLINRGILFDES